MSNISLASQLKIERADKHISELTELVRRFSGTGHHSIVINQDAQRRNWIGVEFGPTALPADDAALIIGDALHNLRSALDILWHEVIRECGGAATKYTRFPIRDTRDKLIAPLNNALEQKQISEPIYDLVLDTIKPYEAGNYPIWALDDLNVRDKHQLIIPMIKWMWVYGVCLEDEEAEVFEMPPLVSEKPWSGKLPSIFDGKTLAVKNHGHSSVNIFFNPTFPFQGEPIIPALGNISVVVSRTIEAFALIFPD